jgi:hypothetical protein
VIIREEAAGWLRVGEIAPQMLGEMRLQISWAAQLIAAVGAAHLTPASDGSHMSMEWLSSQDLLASDRPIHGRQFRMALRVGGFALVLLDMMERPLTEIALDGHNLADLRSWVENAIAGYTGAGPVRLDVGGQGVLANHPVNGGRVFVLDSADACVELARWYAGADIVLRELAAITPGSSPVRVWPERLDSRFRTTVPADGPDVGLVVGMCPGDVTYPDPYWYVVPETVLPVASLKPLSHGGEWHDGEWTGAVLRARRLIPGSASGQRERLVAFLHEAMSVTRESLAVSR